MQMPLFQPESDWRPPSLSDLPIWKDADRIAIDTETKDPDLKKLGPGARRDNSYVVGYSIAIQNGPHFYVPIRHEGGDNVDCNQGLNYLRDQAKAFKGDLVGANLPYDLDHLTSEDITFPNVHRFRDIQVLEPLLNELHDNYSLQAIAKRHGLEGKDEQLLIEAAQAFNIDPKGGMWRLAARFVGPYAERDAIEPLLVLEKQEAAMQQMVEDDLKSRYPKKFRSKDDEEQARLIDDLLTKNQLKTLHDVWDLECQVLPELLKLRQRGILIDQDKLDHVRSWSQQEEAANLAFIKDHTGYDIGIGNVWKANAIAPALEALGVKLKYTKGRGKNAKPVPSIDAKLLDSINHPVAEAIKRARKVNKLRTTFVSSIIRHMEKGRIHASFNQIARADSEDGSSSDIKGVRYGRLSSDKPNIQQQPSRDDFAKMWRSIYIPEPGTIFASNDYSQQEPRWTTHFAAEMNLEKARAAAQAYHDDPNLDNHQFMAELTGLDRKYAKAIFLGLCYGEGGAKLATDLGLPTRMMISGKVGGRWRTVPLDSPEGEQLAKSGRARRFPGAGPEAQAIIDAFDERAPYIRQLADKAKLAASKRGYVTTIWGRRLHFPTDRAGNYDWTHKALNRIIQGSSADQTKMAMVVLARELPEYWMQLQVHDEINASVENPEIAHKAAQIMRECIPARVPFKVDVELGPSWGEAA